MVESTIEKSRVHPQALSGYKGAELYDRVRPHYPASAIVQIRDAVAAKDDVHVVEIGAGTGIFTRDLMDNPAWSTSTSEIVAVEPNPEMRGVLARETANRKIKVSAVDGTFENTGVPDAWANVIIMATSFHWCQDHDSALAEFTRILKPKGIIAIIFNVHDYHHYSWVKKLDDIREGEAQEKGGSRHLRTTWGKVFDHPAYQGRFEQPVYSESSYYEAVTQENAIQRFLTWSGIAVLSSDAKQRAIDSAVSIITESRDKCQDGLEWENKSEGTFKFPYLAELDICRGK